MTFTEMTLHVELRLKTSISYLSTCLKRKQRVPTWKKYAKGFSYLEYTNPIFWMWMDIWS